MGIGPMHMILLIVIILIFFGPSRLPGLGKSLGEAIRGFKKGLDNNEIDVTNSTKRENLDAAEKEKKDKNDA